MEGSQKTNTAIALVEALANEAKRTAIGRSTEARLIIMDDADDDRHLRYMAVVYFDDSDPATADWKFTGRGIEIPRGVYFDVELSNAVATGTGDSSSGLAEVGSGTGITFPKGSSSASHFYYEFNSQGICMDSDNTNNTDTNFLNDAVGGALVIKAGALNPSSGDITDKGKDRNGFVIWRNGNTSTVRDLSSY